MRQKVMMKNKMFNINILVFCFLFITNIWGHHIDDNSNLCFVILELDSTDQARKIFPDLKNENPSIVDTILITNLIVNVINDYNIIEKKKYDKLQPSKGLILHQVDINNYCCQIIPFSFNNELKIFVSLYPKNAISDEKAFQKDLTEEIPYTIVINQTNKMVERYEIGYQSYVASDTP